jgi:hypothetical protein
VPPFLLAWLDYAQNLHPHETVDYDWLHNVLNDAEAANAAAAKGRGLAALPICNTEQ